MNIDGHDATIVREVNAKSSNGAGQVPYTNKEPQGLLLEALKMAATFAFGNAVAPDAAWRHKSDACLGFSPKQHYMFFRGPR